MNAGYPACPPVRLHAIAALMMLALSNLVDVYGSVPCLIVALVAIASGIAVAYIGHSRGTHPLVQLAALLAAQSTMGPIMAFAPEPPDPSTPLRGWQATFSAYQYLIAVEPPLGTSDGSLMALWTMGLWLSYIATALALAVSGLRRMLCALPPIAAMVICALLGTDSGWMRHISGALFAMLLVYWLSAHSMRVGAGLAFPVCATAMAAALLVAAALPQHRLIMRESYQPPLTPHATISPLSAMRSLVKYHRDDALLTVTGLPKGTPIRIAAMEHFDGSIWSYSQDAEFRPTGPAAQTGNQDRPFTATFRIGEGLSGSWLPLAGIGSEIAGEGIGAPVYYHADTATAMLSNGLVGGSSYTQSGSLPSQPSDTLIGQAEATPPKPYETDMVPDAVCRLAIDIAGGQSTAGASALALARTLRQSGWFSHGLEGDYPSAAGHGNYRITDLLEGEVMVGDSEQYASAMALMARELGMRARVVYGFLPLDERGDISSTRASPFVFTGNDICAWVEIQFRDLGWVMFHPTPRVTRTPQADHVPSPPDPQTLVRQPPVPLTDPLRDHNQPQGSSVIGGDHADSPTAEEPDANRPQPIAAIVCWSSPIVLVLAAGSLIMALKAWQLNRARTRGPPGTRIIEGWRALYVLALQCDRSGFGASSRRRSPRPSGPTPSKASCAATRSQQAALIAGIFAMPTARLVSLARQADRAAFSDHELDERHALTFWHDIDWIRHDVLHALPGLQRLRVLFSLRAIHAPIEERQTLRQQEGRRLRGRCRPQPFRQRIRHALRRC